MYNISITNRVISAFKPRGLKLKVNSAKKDSTNDVEATSKTNISFVKDSSSLAVASASDAVQKNNEDFRKFYT